MAKYAVYLIIFLFFYIFLPLYLSIAVHAIPFKILLTFYLINIAVIIHLLKKYSEKNHDYQLKREDLQETINIAKDEFAKEQKNQIAFQEKIKRYSNLKVIIEEINQNLNLASVTEQLISIAFSSISGNKGTCILYLVDKETHRLNLYKTKKENKELIIKAKEGDIFDAWVLRHASPLLIEDIRNDFRFDLERVKAQEERFVSSLISAPFISARRFLGLLRLDNSQIGIYSQDDLRFLVTLCDVGAIALENAELYLKTEDLAIHDGLTSLYRKGYFLERLKEEYKRSTRQNKPFSMLMLDIDYFKKYNDTFGHMAGDIVLKELSSILTGVFKDKSAIIGRFGGEEFCVILAGTDKQKAFLVAEVLRRHIESYKITLRQKETKVTVSIGVANFPEDARDETELMLKVDKAMYEAKKQGRNRVVAAG